MTDPGDQQQQQQYKHNKHRPTLTTVTYATDARPPMDIAVGVAQEMAMIQMALVRWAFCSQRKRLLH